MAATLLHKGRLKPVVFTTACSRPGDLIGSTEVNMKEVFVHCMDITIEVMNKSSTSF